MYKFFGLTAANYLYLGISPAVFGSCIKNYTEDKQAILLMRQQFIELKDFLNDKNLMFFDRSVPEYKKIHIDKLRLEKAIDNGQYSSDPEEGERLLSKINIEYDSIPKNVNNVINGVPLSPLSRRVIEVIYSKRHLLDGHIGKLEWSEVDRVSDRFFGKEIYVLKKLPISTLFYHFKEFAKELNDIEKLNDTVNNMFDVISSKFVNSEFESEGTSKNSTKDYIDNQYDSIISKIDFESFKTIAGPEFAECTIDDFHASSVELHQAGLIGFTIFTKELYESFLKTYIPSYKTDVKVFRGSNLGVFTAILKRGANSYGTLGEEI